MDNSRHWTGYDTVKLIVALILLIILIILLLQGGAPGPDTPTVNPAAPTTAPATTIPPTTAVLSPSPTLTATAPPSPTPTLAPTATSQPTLAPTATPKPTAIPQATTVQPIVLVVDVIPGSSVKLWFANLPANEKFAVRMGASGTGAVGDPIVAHFISPDSGRGFAWIEILSELTGSARIDLRIDNGAGLSATTSFDNTSASTPPAVP